MIVFLQIALLLAATGSRSAGPVFGLLAVMMLLSPLTWAAVCGFLVAGRDD